MLDVVTAGTEARGQTVAEEWYCWGRTDWLTDWLVLPLVVDWDTVVVERIQDWAQTAAGHPAVSAPVVNILPLVVSLQVVLRAEDVVRLVRVASEPLPATHLGEVVDPGKLQDGGHAVEEAADDEPVQGGGVLDLGQVRPAVHGDGRQCQDSRHSWHYQVQN